MVSKWIGNLKERPEDECRKMQEAFERSHNSKEWGMICMIYEADDCLDIVIRDEEDINLRCLCGVGWKKSYLTPEQLKSIQEKQQELEQEKKRSVACRTIGENVPMGYYLSRFTNEEMHGWNRQSTLPGRSGTRVAPEVWL